MPSLEGAVRKIRSLMKIHRLDKVFVATDAIRKGMELQCLSFLSFRLDPWFHSGQT